ncbi:MAG: sulfite exporter TauE/SafE family protein [Burkholderiaceae bacterium]|nr:sulfite exporter TauE/SafE family protein [Burkholderiaceae bacterium]
MDTALILGAGLMGLAGTPHCAAMCGAPCAAVTQRCGMQARHGLMAGFAMGRLLSYALGGAAVAASVGAVSLLGSMAPVLRPLWTLLHLAVLGLGLWLLLTGRQPAWWSRLGSNPVVAAAPPAGWQRMAAPLRAGAAGGMLLALPCGLLQSALLIAALANTPVQGALAMGSFAAASSLGLWLPGMLAARAPGGVSVNVLMLRLAGATLVAASAWALSHDLWLRWTAWCQTG